MARPRKLPASHQCQSCGSTFVEYPSARRRFCGLVCARAWQTKFGKKTGPRPKYERPPTFVCKFCGIEKECTKIFFRERSKGYVTRQKYCSKSCANRGRRTGKLSTDKNGYLYSTVDGKQVYEHRRVMEKVLGRPLHSDETVHHRNGNRGDFAEDNLELWSSRHGKGQRVEDKIEFSLNFLRDYGYTLNQTPMSQAIAGIAGLC